MRRNDPVVLAWVAGLGLAALIYFVGPGRFLFRFWDTVHLLGWRIGELIADLSVLALDVVRALAIGLYVTFVALAVAVVRRGGPGRGALLGVTLGFLVLVGQDGLGNVSNLRWTAALILSAVGATVMTGRLRHAGAGLPTRP